MFLIINCLKWFYGASLIKTPTRFNMVYMYTQIFTHTHTHTHTAASIVAFSEAPGVVPHMTGKTPLDFFHLFFDDEVKHIIHFKSCENAVRYLEENQEFLTTHPHARAHDWVKAPMSLKEVDALLSIVIAMGLVGLPTQR